MLLNETNLSNQHVEIVNLLLDSDFLISELEVLAYFVRKITLLYLLCVEISTQHETLNTFPQLYEI